MSELESLEYEISHNSCKKIGEDRFKRINQKVGFIKGKKEAYNGIVKLIDFCKKQEADELAIYYAILSHIELHKKECD